MAGLILRKVAKFYEELCKFEMLSAYALRLLILTATRTKEVIESQFDEFDLQKKVWTIPADKMKVRKKHKVPLSDEAINIEMISTSEIKISVVLEEKYKELAVRTLHDAFELDKN